jgi:hypothetical protein
VPDRVFFPARTPTPVLRIVPVSAIVFLPVPVTPHLSMLGAYRILILVAY